MQCQYNAVDGGWTKHRARWTPGAEPLAQPGAVRHHARLRGSFQLPLGRRHLHAQCASGGRLPPSGGGLGLVSAAAVAALPDIPRCSGRVRALRRVDGPLGLLVVRPRPELDRLRPRRPLSRGGGGARPHAGPRPPAAHGGLRLSGGRRGGRRVRLPRQGRPRGRDARAHLCAARQPRGLLERPRPDDGDGAGGRAGSCRRPQGSPRLEGAGRRRRGATLLHLLLHLVSRRLGRARCDAGTVFRLHDDASRQFREPGGHRGARGGGAVASARPRHPLQRDLGRCFAHPSGPHPAALVSGGAARRRGGAGCDRARAARRAVATLGARRRRSRGAGGIGGRHRRWLVALPREPRRRDLGQGPRADLHLGHR